MYVRVYFFFKEKKRKTKPMSLLVSRTELFSSNRTVSNDQKGTQTLAHISLPSFLGEHLPKMYAWAVHAFLSRQALGGTTYL